METEFVRAEDMQDQGRIYLIQNGRRHWIPSPEVAQSYGWDLTKVKILPFEEICKIRRSYNIAYNFEHSSLPSVCKSNIVFHRVWGRQWFGSQFEGHGLEISAASSPWPCKPGVKVDYTDPYREDEGCKTGYENKDYVPLDYQAGLEDMSKIEKKDYDFICCSHVIEHTPNVLLAIKNIYEHLSDGGMFVMAVPHMNYTFDCLRSLTDLHHIVKDYEDFSRERNILHIVDYFEKVRNGHFGEKEDITKHCYEYLAGNKNIDIHYHTFTEENMAQIMMWFQENIYKWNTVEIFNRLEGANEFFVRLVK